MATLLKKALGFWADKKETTPKATDVIIPEATVQAKQPPPSPSPLPPMLGEGEFKSPSPKVGRGVGGEGQALGKKSIRYRWVQNLSPQNLTELAALTFPNLSRRWQRQPQQGPLEGVAAFVDEQMVGLAIAELQPSQAEIISLFVLPDCRHQGIASQLLSYLERGLIKANCPKLCLSYRTSDLTAQALEPLLQQQSWQAPQTDFVLTHAHIDQLKQAPWLHKYPLPESFTVFPWGELTEEERSRLLTHKTYPDSLTPFDTDPRLEPSNSLGLRYKGEVIGWCINHRVASDSIRYSTLFVEERFQRLGRGFSLLAEAVKRQIEQGIPYASAAVASNNPLMMRCMERHYTPYAARFSESRSSEKVLGIERGA